MKRLCLMRHAPAGAGDHAERSTDDDPSLTPNGMTKARAAAWGLAELEIEAPVLPTSPFLRAVQKAEIVSQVLGIPSDQIRRTDILKPGTSPSQLVEEILPLEAEAVVCAGHSPQLDDAISHIPDCQSRITRLKKAAVACLELSSGSPPRGFLLWLYPPRMLRRLGR